MRAVRLSAIVLLAPILEAQDLGELEKRITEFSLPNGLHFILAERHEAPVITFQVRVKAGSVDDPAGGTGLAYMLEHMVFQGTETIGSRDWAAEKQAMDAAEAVYDRLESERNKGPKADQDRVEKLQMQSRMAADKAESYAEPNQYRRILVENGGREIRAAASQDSTAWECSLPSNRMELWFLMESQHLLRPVFREFYKEREAVADEQRTQVDANAQGKLLQEFMAAAFVAHPYRNPERGWPSDLAGLRSSDAGDFFEQYYAPSNITIAIVGDVNPAEARRMAERYFGLIPSRPLPPEVRTLEPPQAGPRLVVVEAPGPPLAMIGFKRPSQRDKDDAVFDILQFLLSGNRTGLMYKELVQDKRLAVNTRAMAAYPEGRFPNLFLFVMSPVPGHGIEELGRALDALLARLKDQPVDAAALDAAKTRARAAVVLRLASNSSLASMLSLAYINYGDWKKVSTVVDNLNRVSAADIQRVSRQYFVPLTRTVAYTVPPGQSGWTATPAGRGNGQ